MTLRHGTALISLLCESDTDLCCLPNRAVNRLEKSDISGFGGLLHHSTLHARAQLGVAHLHLLIVL